MREVAPFFVMNYPPLVVEPKPWEGFNGSGGYFSDFIDIPLVKLYSDRYNKGIVANYFDTHPNKTKRFFNVINSIQKTKWKVNTKMLDVYNTIYKDHIECFKSEFTLLGGLPSDNLPDPYTEFEMPDPKDKKAYREYKSKIHALDDKLTTIKSKLLATKLGLSIANRFSKYDVIYYTYQVDFRGRIYPIQQHLNPQAAKHMKPLLHFAEGKPLDTDSAYRWFMIHGANVYGYDKLLYDDRIKKMEEKQDEVLWCARNPYKYTEWTEAEEPFAYLSWCFEYADYLTNPVSFRTHIPIALDATCSGIQIYSGLLLDNKGAEAVNVVNHNNNTKVADIYKDVADVVNRILETQDYPAKYPYSTNDPDDPIKTRYIDCRTIGDNMCGKINRKMTKRNVMTFPYNVSAFGMKDQLKSEIYEPMEKDGNQPWGEAPSWQVSVFMAQLNNRAIEEVVKGAVKGRDFLKSLTKDVVKKGKYVFYTTPEFNFPVLHRVTKYDITRITTSLAKLSLKTPTTALNLGSMVNGIAPNYIHSLDATLMFLTIEKLLDDDVTDFALIHDSYGVHAKDVDKLSRYVREAFIQIFENKPLLNFVKQVAPSKLDEANELMIGDLELKEVLCSNYFFS
jgi:DNA-directed RNA polymerase